MEAYDRDLSEFKKGSGKESGDSKGGGGSGDEAAQEQIESLEKEVEDLKQENEDLKKQLEESGQEVGSPSISTTL